MFQRPLEILVGRVDDPRIRVESVGDSLVLLVVLVRLFEIRLLEELEPGLWFAL